MIAKVATWSRKNCAPWWTAEMTYSMIDEELCDFCGSPAEDCYQDGPDTIFICASCRDRVPLHVRLDRLARPAGI